MNKVVFDFIKQNKELIQQSDFKELYAVAESGDHARGIESLSGDNPVIDNDELNQILLKLIDLVGDKSIMKDVEEL